MSSNYDIIDSGICPKCKGKMRSSDHTENNGFNWYCDPCQMLYKFNDDPGPGSYTYISLKPTIPDKKRLEMIADIIETVDNRAMACDGPVPSTMEEMSQEEMSTIYALAKGKDPKWRPVADA